MNGTDVSARALIEAAEFVGSRIVIEPGSVKYPGDDHYTTLWFVSGGGLGRASGATLADALRDWLEGLVTLAEAEPLTFGRFGSMPHFGSDGDVK